MVAIILILIIIIIIIVIISDHGLRTWRMRTGPKQKERQTDRQTGRETETPFSVRA